jgi:hypothetical protein
LLDVEGIHTGLAGGEPSNGFKTVGDRFLGAVHDLTGGQKLLVLPLDADIEVY